jgi:hypothetical protein
MQMWRAASGRMSYRIVNYMRTKGNSDGYFVWEKQKLMPKFSYRAHKTKGKKVVFKTLVTSKTEFLNLFVKKK